MSFDYPNIIPGQKIPDHIQEFGKELMDKLKIQVLFPPRSKLHSLVLVKGSEKDSENVMTATDSLLRICKIVSAS